MERDDREIVNFRYTGWVLLGLWLLVVVVIIQQ